MTDEILERMSAAFDGMYADFGRPSIPPDKLLRVQLLQMLYSVRSERLLMEEIDYSILFRWFVGLNLDEAVWDATSFTKNRNRQLDAAAEECLEDGSQFTCLIRNQTGTLASHRRLNDHAIPGNHGRWRRSGTQTVRSIRSLAKHPK
jgi:hypothetical protein